MSTRWKAGWIRSGPGAATSSSAWKPRRMSRVDLLIGARTARRGRRSRGGFGSATDCAAGPPRCAKIPIPGSGRNWRCARRSRRWRCAIRTGGWPRAIEKELAVTVDRPKARFSAWYEFFPRSCAPEPGRHGTFRDAEARLDYAASMGFDVVYLPPIHPIGTQLSQGPEQRHGGRARRCRQPVGHRIGGGRPQGHSSRTGQHGGFRALRREGRRTRARGGARHRLPVLAGPSLRAGASRLVPPAAGRHHPVCRESAQEIPGHLSARIRNRRLARAVGRTDRRGAVLDRKGDPHFPRGQSAHQGVSVLGVADRRR